MSNTYYLQSADDGLVFDIKTPVASGSSLQALVKKTETNQQWTFESVSGQAGYFYILSADDGLAVDQDTRRLRFRAPGAREEDRGQSVVDV